jgi:hypothetical protein
VVGNIRESYPLGWIVAGIAAADAHGGGDGDATRG